MENVKVSQNIRATMLLCGDFYPSSKRDETNRPLMKR